MRAYSTRMHLDDLDSIAHIDKKEQQVLLQQCICSWRERILLRQRCMQHVNLQPMGQHRPNGNPGQAVLDVAAVLPAVSDIAYNDDRHLTVVHDVLADRADEELLHGTLVVVAHDDSCCPQLGCLLADDMADAARVRF